MMGEGGWIGGGMWLFWILLIVIVVVLVRALAGSGSASRPAHQQSPMEILKARYARGEIDEEEFKRRRRDLES
jgi:putative membrane protein